MKAYEAEFMNKNGRNNLSQHLIHPIRALEQALRDQNQGDFAMKEGGSAAGPGRFDSRTTVILERNRGPPE